MGTLYRTETTRQKSYNLDHTKQCGNKMKNLHQNLLFGFFFSKIAHVRSLALNNKLENAREMKFKRTTYAN